MTSWPSGVLCCAVLCCAVHAVVVTAVQAAVTCQPFSTQCDGQLAFRCAAHAVALVLHASIGCYRCGSHPPKQCVGCPLTVLTPPLTVHTVSHRRAGGVVQHDCALWRRRVCNGHGQL